MNINQGGFFFDRFVELPDNGPIIKQENNMLTKILLILAIIIIVFCAYTAMQPDDFRYQRTATINAKPEVVFEEVNVARNWEKWSPWAKVDPNAKFTYEGPESGVGSITRWKGNMEVGEGSSTITESKPNEFIQLRLDFLKPMKATNTAEFTFKPEGDTTVVTWAMYGKSNFIGKAMSVIMNCEKMVGGQFEKGLANLKAIAEAKK